MGITQFTFILADGKKTIETLQSTKNQTKTARLLRLSFEQVHGVMLRAVERGLEKRDKNCIYKHVCMDEKSIRRGHEYVSMLYDGETGQVIEVESGRKSESVDNLCTRALTEEQRNAVETVCTDMWEAFINGALKYFPNARHCHDLYHCVTYRTRALTEEQRNAVETVCTDMWEAFINGALKYFPNARHCHDLYHCVTYLNNAVDKVRKREVKEFKELRHTKYIWLKDMSRYTPNDRMRFDNCVTYLNNAVDKVRKREVKEFKELRHTKYIWLKDMSRYTPNDRMRFDKLENAEYQVSQAWKVKELFRNLLRLYYHGDMEAYGMLGDWMADALRYNIGEINDVVFMFKRHLKGIISAMVTGCLAVQHRRNQRCGLHVQETP